jgi:TRAP-type uncharacterized transport system substrate-binding protein
MRFPDSHKPLIAALIILPVLAAAECELPTAGTPSDGKVRIDLYVQGDIEIAPPAWVLDRGKHVSPEERVINECSNLLHARSISDSLPERLNIFAHLPEEARSAAFIAVSSVDQKMAVDKTGPYWHAYVTAFPDLRFVGATVRLAYGLATLDETIQAPGDLVGKKVGLVARPSSIRALQEILLIRSWGIYDRISVKEYLPAELAGALNRREVDAVFMPAGRMTGRELMPTGVDFDDPSLRWISISTDDILIATNKTPVLAERVVFSPAAGATNGDDEVGLVTFDVAWFTFASTPDAVVYEFINAAQQVCPPQAPSCNGRSPQSMIRWPELETDLLHPGALKFYQEIGVEPTR